MYVNVLNFNIYMYTLENLFTSVTHHFQIILVVGNSGKYFYML